MYLIKLLTRGNRLRFAGFLLIIAVLMTTFAAMAAAPIPTANTSPVTALGSAQVANLPVEDNCGALYAPPPYANYYATIDFYVTAGGAYNYSDAAAQFTPYRMIYAAGDFDPANPTGCIYSKSTSNKATFTETLAANVQYTLVMSHEGRIGSDGANVVGAPGETFTATLAGPGEVCWGELGSCDDADGDNVSDLTDNCPNTPNPGQENGYGTPELGDACEDSDADGINDDVDVCPTQNPTTDVDPADGCEDDAPEIVEPGDLNPPDGLPAYVLDGRLNPLMGDGLAVAYPGVDDSGTQALNLYCVDTFGGVSFAMQVTADDLPEEIPAQNTLVKASETCNVAFYALSSGEYQLNIGPDFEGKVYELIFTGLNMENLMMRQFNTLD